jgi:hypothetical protein
MFPVHMAHVPFTRGKGHTEQPIAVLERPIKAKQMLIICVARHKGTRNREKRHKRTVYRYAALPSALMPTLTLAFLTYLVSRTIVGKTISRGPASVYARYLCARDWDIRIPGGDVYFTSYRVIMNSVCRTIHWHKRWRDTLKIRQHRPILPVA